MKAHLKVHVHLHANIHVHVHALCIILIWTGTEVVLAFRCSPKFSQQCTNQRSSPRQEYLPSRVPEIAKDDSMQYTYSNCVTKSRRYAILADVGITGRGNSICTVAEVCSSSRLLLPAHACQIEFISYYLWWCSDKDWTDSTHHFSKCERKWWGIFW